MTEVLVSQARLQIERTGGLVRMYRWRNEKMPYAPHSICGEPINSEDACYFPRWHLEDGVRWHEGGDPRNPVTSLYLSAGASALIRDSGADSVGPST